MTNAPELIVALDFPARRPALRIARRLKGTVSWIKAGMELFIVEGPRIVRDLKVMGFKVFLDLKLHDIPNTVRGAVLSASRLHADMLTIHLSGGERMVRAAVEAAQEAEHKPLLLGVTVLTSIAPDELAGSGSQSPSPLAAVARKLALKAQSWGMDGIVCSGNEVRGIKRAANLLCVTPGIRPETKKNASDDQRRTVTPDQAARNGSDFLVVGRPVTAASDPVRAAEDILSAVRKAGSPPCKARG